MFLRGKSFHQDGVLHQSGYSAVIMSTKGFGCDEYIFDSKTFQHEIVT